MKLFYSIVFLVFTTFGFSQEYKFNLLTKYTVNWENHQHEKIVYSNDSDSDYFLIIKKTSTENQAYLTDLKNKKVHHLLFKETKNKEDVFFTFDYLKTEKLIPFEVNQNFFVEFETIKQDSIYKNVKMTIYKNKKKKKIFAIQELVVKNHPKNLFPLFRYSCMHTLEYRTEIDLGETGIVESSTSKTNNYWKTHLDYYKEVNLTLKIPTKNN